MSRVAKRPVELNKDTSVTISEGVLAAKGKLGELVLEIHPLVDIIQEESSLLVKAKDECQRFRYGWKQGILSSRRRVEK